MFLRIAAENLKLHLTANANALMLRDKADANNQSVLAKLDQMQTQALQAYQAQVITPVNAAF